MPNRLRGQWPVLLLAALALAVFLVAYLRLWVYILDDTYISLRYAQHLAEGHGLVYNLGERVEGYTNFLWTVILAIPVALHLDIVLFVRAVLAALAIGTALATYRLAGLVLGPLEGDAPRTLVALPALLVLASPLVVTGAAEGLETMLFTLLLVIATAAYLAEQRAPGFPVSAVACAMLGMTRPEGAVYGVLSLALSLLLRRPRPYVLRSAAIFVGVFGTYFVLRAAYYDQLLPNTFYAKSGGSLYLLGRGWDELAAFAIAGLGGGIALLLAAPALRDRRLRGAAVLLLGVALLRVRFQLWSGGPWMGRFRFLLPTLPFLYVLMTAGLLAPPLSAIQRRIGAVLLAGLLLVPGWIQHARREPGMIAYGHQLWQAHGRFGRDLARRTRPDAVIAMDDAGLGPLLAGRTNVDMLGLNDTHIAHLPGLFSFKYDTGYVLGRRPDLIVLLATVAHPRTDQDYRIPGHAALARDPRFLAEYAFVRDYPHDPTYHLLVYRRRDSTAVPADF